MTANMGQVDRVIRIVVGLVLIIAAFASGWPVFEGALIKYGAVVVGLIFVLTSSISFCPLYTIVGIRTNKAPDAGAEAGVEE